MLNFKSFFTISKNGLTKSTPMKVFAAASVLFVTFQNCQGGFQPLSQNYSLSSLSSLNTFNFFAPQVFLANGKTLTNQSQPQITINGLPNDFAVRLFSDAACLVLVASGSVANSVANLTPTNSLADGNFHFYTNYTTTNALNSMSSPCYDSNLTVTINTKIPNPPNSLSLSLPSGTNSGALTSIVVSVGNPNAQTGLVANLFSTASCAIGSLVGSATVGNGANVSLPISIPGTAAATFTFYANLTDGAGNVSSCSTANVSYSFNPLADPLSSPANPPKIISVSSTTLGSSSGAAPFNAGKKVNVTLTYSDVVTVTGAPRILLNSGSAAYARHNSSSSNSISLIYTVNAGDNTSVLDAGAANLDLNGGSISSKAGVPAKLSLPAAGSLGSLSSVVTFVIDTTPPPTPTVLSLQSPTASHSLFTQPSILISTTEPNSTVTLYSDSACKNSLGSGKASSTSLVITTNVLAPVSLPFQYSFYAESVDSAGNASACSSASVSYVLDSQNPYVLAITNLTAPSNNGLPFGIGSKINFAVQFSRPILLSGVPQIAINASSKAISGALSSSANDTINFTYTVNSGDSASPIKISSTAIALNGASITDLTSGTYAASLSLPTNLIDALANGYKDYVDGISPSVSALNLSSAANPTPNQAIVTVTASKPISSASIFTDAACSQSAGNATGSPGTGAASNSPLQNEALYPSSIDVKSNVATNIGSATKYYAKVTDPVGNSSACSSVTYTYNYGPIHILGSGSSANSTCGITYAGTLACWGDNTSGQLGFGDLAKHSSPVYVSGITTATAVAVGQNFACAIVGGGSVMCWGDNTYGQLGNSSCVSSSTPVPVTGISNAKQISLGEIFACALLNDNTVKCWGDNTQGQLGLAPGVTNTTSSCLASTSFPIPMQSQSGGSAINIMASSQALGSVAPDGTSFNFYGNLVASFAGSVATSGFNGSILTGASGFVSGGALGQQGTFVFARSNNISYTNFLVATPTSGLSQGDGVLLSLDSGISYSINSLFLGGYHYCLLTSKGVLRCVGDNSFGQLGQGVATAFAVPGTTSLIVNLPNGALATSVAIGRSHSCAATSAAVYCWGDNTLGQIANASPILSAAPPGVTISTTSYSPTPSQVTGF